MIREVIVEKEVPVFVDVVTKVVRPVFKEVIVEEFYDVPIDNDQIEFADETEQVEEVADQDLRWWIEEKQLDERRLQQEKAKLQQLNQETRSKIQAWRGMQNSEAHQRYFSLMTRFYELQSRLKNAEIENSILVNKSKKTLIVKDDIIEKNSRVDSLISKLDCVIGENEKLIEELTSKGNILKSLTLDRQSGMLNSPRFDNRPLNY